MGVKKATFEIKEKETNQDSEGLNIIYHLIIGANVECPHIQ